MKNLLLLLIITLSTQLLFSQTWKKETTDSDFDGRTFNAYVVGTGNDYPYNKPTLIVSRKQNEDELYIGLSGHGFYTMNSGVSISFVFSKQKGVIYTCNGFNTTKDGKWMFLNKFIDNDGKRYSKFDFIKFLKESSTVSARVSNDYGKNDMKFSLSGSTNALNSVVSPSKLAEYQLAYQKEQQEKESVNISRQQLYEKLFAIAKDYKLSEDYYDSFEITVKNDLGLSTVGEITLNEEVLTANSLEFKPRSGGMFEAYGYVVVSYVLENGEKVFISGDWTVDKDSPLFDN